MEQASRDAEKYKRMYLHVRGGFRRIKDDGWGRFVEQVNVQVQGGVKAYNWINRLEEILKGCKRLDKMGYGCFYRLQVVFKMLHKMGWYQG